MSIYIFLFLISDKKTSKCSSCQRHLFEGEVKMVLNKYVPEVNSSLNRPLNQKKRGQCRFSSRKCCFLLRLESTKCVGLGFAFVCGWFQETLTVDAMTSNAFFSAKDSQSPVESLWRAEGGVPEARSWKGADWWEKAATALVHPNGSGLFTGHNNWNDETNACRGSRPICM